ncbi:ABC transporter substrate-binding protein [Curtobacterium sp. Leaf261]|uniref:ABC transporter substrate-binding protein n=1 Tax=Curtobacterium sp. Leaf261 TaxID=1736311 RepID=UPI0006F7F47C|nr:iron-siderophore ABC transporter substrate-binding protein [Curtobacterium sp. Leaf261]KQO64976.1 ABC transporter substrate-binding protein [Curtobacterium sp. Leaf261]
MHRRILLTAAVAASAALVLTGCGTTEAANDDASSSGTTISMKDATGATVTLDGPARKVVGTEWNVVENLVSLGVDPVGVADVAGYRAWDAAVPLTNEPEDIGTRGEPSMDTIAALSPDLIVATTDLSASAVKQLRRIAPVLEVRSADASGQIDQMLTNLDMIAEATGTRAEAAAVTKGFRSTIADGRAAIEEAGLDGTRFAFADGYVDANQVSIRPYVEGSLVADVTTELGLRNAWQLEGDAAYGLASTDVEGLTELGDDVQFLYIGNKADGEDPFADALADNAVWKSLPLVEAGNVHRLPDGIWMFGGPESMEAYVEAVVAALTK